MRAAAIRVLVVDDEPPARARLERLVGELSGLELAGTAANGREALERAARCRPDVVLMDIRMPGMDGVEAARHLSRLDTPPAVIFTTAYDEYAIQAFEAAAVGYLLKPVRRERLQAALDHAVRPTRPQLAALAASASHERRSHICATLRDELRVVPLQDILYFQAESKYVTVRHLHGEVLIDESLRILEKEFGEDFLRIHRNALVAVRYLSRIERLPGGQLVVRVAHTAEPLPVSRRHAGEVRRRLRRLALRPAGGGEA